MAPNVDFLFQETMDEYIANSKKYPDYKCIIWKKKADDEWDNFLEFSEHGRYEQTSSWASVKGLYGWKPIRIVLKSRNSIVGGAQILYKKIFHFRKIGYITKGPIFNTANLEEAKIVLDAICSVAKKIKIDLLFINPSINMKSLNGFLKIRRFSPDLVGSVIGATSIINLEKDTDTLLKQMKKNTRKNIKKGQKESIKIRKGKRNEISDFFNLMAITCKRQGVKPNPPDETFFYTLWDRFDNKRAVNLFIAEYNDEKVAAALSISFGNRFSSYKIGWSGKYKERKPNDILIWEMIRWAKHEGYKYFDFVGVDRKIAELILERKPLPEGWELTTTHYKLGFGGNVTFFPDLYVYLYNPLARFIYESIFNRIKQFSVFHRFTSLLN